MATPRRTKTAVIAALSIISVVAGLHLRTLSAAPPPQQPNPWNASAFQGAWCAQGDRTKQCSISVNGPFLTFTNETGSTSSGHFGGMGQNVVTADQWNFVQGNSEDEAPSLRRKCPPKQSPDGPPPLPWAGAYVSPLLRDEGLSVTTTLRGVDCAFGPATPLTKPSKMGHAHLPS
jgi:hypothetical protein